MISLERLKEVLEYDPSTGEFRWRIDIGTRARKGALAGCRKRTGRYAEIQIDGKLYKRHRLAFLYVHGWVPAEIDHISRDRTDDRIGNLRPATRAQNKANSSFYKNNKSGMRGVYWHARQRKWIACIQVNKKRMGLGSFDTVEAASEAYRLAAMKHFGEYANLSNGRS